MMSESPLGKPVLYDFDLLCRRQTRRTESHSECWGERAVRPDYGSSGDPGERLANQQWGRSLHGRGESSPAVAMPRKAQQTDPRAVCEENWIPTVT